MKRINVLLVSPKSYDDSYDQKLTEYRLFPFSVVYLVNFLKKEDACDVDYMDLVMESRETLWEKLCNEHFDLIGFTSTAEARFATIEMICKVKTISPKTKIVVGGYFFSNTFDEAFKSVLEIDFLVRGEGEVTLLELVRKLSEKDDDFSNIDGLSYRSKDKVVHNKPRKSDIPLEKFQIDYSLITKPGYDMLFPIKNWEERKDIKAFPIMLGRGCSQHCIFCTHKYLSYRVMKIENIMQQIDWAIKTLGTKYFLFADPSFYERKKFVEEFCNYLIEHKYDIKWYCEGRVDIPGQLIRLMAKAGCISIDFAMESGSNRILATLKKKIDVSKIEKFASTCHECGIRASYFTMISLPDERLEDFDKTFKQIVKLFTYGMKTSVAPLLIYPGTELEVIAKQRGVISKNFSWYDKGYECKCMFVNDRAKNIPHYIEKLDEKQVVELIKKVAGFYKEKEEQKIANAITWRFLFNRLIDRIESVKTGKDIACLFSDAAKIIFLYFKFKGK